MLSIINSDVRTTEIYLDEKHELEREADMLADMEDEYRGAIGGAMRFKNYRYS